MKKLLIMRHAKSDWSTGEPDFDRPLNQRGKSAAPTMGTEILRRNITLDLIISSPAKRARQTAKRVAKNCAYSRDISFDEKFYYGDDFDVLVAVQAVDNANQTVMVIGHNPTWEVLVTKLLETNQYITMPTAALVSVNFDIDNWEDLDFGNGRLDFVQRVKDL